MFLYYFSLEVSFILMSLGQTRRPIINESLGPPGFNSVWTYLDYEEPAFDSVEGFTADDFTDDYAGFYTKQNRALSFEWELTNDGEIPWAGMILGIHQTSIDRGCGATLITERHLLTPCACVRTYVFKTMGREDREYALKLRGVFYESDQGKEIYVVIDTVQFRRDLFDAKGYPNITEAVGVDLCLEKWTHFGPTPENVEHYLGYYDPALLKFSPEVSAGVVGPWPPPTIRYDDGPFKDPLVHSNFEFYSMKDSDTFGAHIVSFNFKPYEQSVKSWDNFNREINYTERQIELYVKLCSQTNCVNSPELAALSVKVEGLNVDKGALFCWCDNPETKEELMFQNWKDADVSHFIKSVHGGLPGAPVIHRGAFVGWQVEPVYLGKHVDDTGVRGTLSRGINARLIEWINWKIPELKGGNRPNVHDRNRPNFAIHDQKIFLPDPDLTEEDVDLVGWSKEGISLRQFSGVESFSVVRNILLVVSLLIFGVLFS